MIKPWLDRVIDDNMPAAGAMQEEIGELRAALEVVTKERDHAEMAANVEAAWADELRDNAEHLERLLGWAYGKLAPFSMSKMDDALMLDEIKLYFMEKGTP